MRRTFIAIAVLGLALAAGVTWLISRGALLDSARLRIADEAARALGREVVVDRVGGDPFRGIVLSGVRIGAPPGAPDAGPLLVAPRITVFVDPGRLARDLAARRGIAAAITRVELDRPFLALARDAGGRWNYADLLQRSPGAAAAPPAFRGVVEVREGVLTFADALRLPRRTDPAPFAARFERITGALDFGRAPLVGIAVDAANTDGDTPALIRVAGTATLGEATFDLDVQTRGGSVDVWGPYIVRLPWLEWTGGTFDGTVHLLASRWRGGLVLDYRGSLTMRNGQARLLPQQTRISAIHGPLLVTGLGVETEGLTMAVDASPVWVRGTITHHAGVHLDLALRSKSLDLRTLQTLLFPRAQVRLAGRVGGDARIVGPLSAPRLDGEIVRATGSIDRRQFSEASGRFSYYGGLLMFEDVDAAAAGGRLRGHARLNLPAGTFFVLADARSVDARLLSGLLLQGDPPVRGRASGVVAAGGGPRGVVAQGRVAMGTGEVLGVRFERLDALVGYDGGRLDLERLEARSGFTRVHGSGRMSPAGELAMEVVGTDVNLRTLAERFGMEPWLAGTADVAGRVGGTLRAPQLTGTVRGRDGHLGPFPFDEARGRFTFTTEGLQTPGLLLFEGGGRYFAAGSIRWAEPSRVDLTVRAADVAAQRLLDIAEVPVRLGGTIESTIRLSGSLRRPLAEGVVELRDGSIEGQPLDRAEAAFRWTGSELVLDRFAARANSSLLEAQGTVARDGALGITFAAAEFDLRDVAILQTDALRAAGRVHLTGTLAGTVRSPALDAAVTSSDLVLNGQRFTLAEGAVRYRDGRLHLAPLTLAQDGGTLTLTGEIALGSEPAVDIRVAADGGELSSLLGLARLRAPFALTGRVEGTIALSGPLSNPRGALDVTLVDGRLGEHVIRQASVAASLEDHAVTLRRLHVAPEEGELVGAGRIHLRGDSEVEFGGRGLDLDLLRPLFGLRRPLEGSLDFTLQVSGSLRDPLVGLSFDTTRGAIGSVPFDRLVVQAYYRNGLLHVEHGLLQEDRHRARLTGSLPLDPARLRLDDTRPMSLRLELVDADLSVLGLLTDRVERAEGPLAGEVTLTGTAARPHMQGRLRVAEGTILLRGIRPALQDVTGELTLSEDLVRVTRLSARMGDGTVAVSGTVAVRAFRLDQFALQLNAERAALDYPQVFTGVADAGLRLAGTAARPEVAGTVTLSQGDLFVSAARTPGAAEARRLNPALDLQLAAGDGLYVNVGALRLPVHGGVRATGTWQQPRLAGEIRADRGTFTAFNTTFTLTEGVATFAEFRGITPFVDAHAETRLNVTRPSPTGTGTRVEPVRVFLHVIGTPDDLTLALSSEPALSREEILAGLARQVGVTRLLAGEAVEDVLRAELSSALFGPFGRAVAQAFGFEEFAIEYDFVRPLTLRIGALLIRNLYITLASELGEPRRTIWALEWRLTPSTMFAFSVDNLGRWDLLYQITHRF